MPWKNKSEDERKDALIGSNAIVKKYYKLGFSSREKKFLEEIASSSSRFFNSISINSSADWLMNHNEIGQTFESFWRVFVIGDRKTESCLNNGGKNFRSRSAVPTRSFRQPPEKSPHQVVVGILPMGLFPGDEKKARAKASETHCNTFLIWLQTYCKAFFKGAKVIVLPPVQIAEVACQYRVNQITGRFQLKANDILNYLRKIKSRTIHCLIAVTMIDLYPKPSWDFVFGLAATNKDGSVGGVGVFSFARFDDIFYETWTQGKDEVKTNPDGTLSFSVFENPSLRADGSVVPITDILLRRACNVMAHEICHMFGIKHCVWMKCLMNGSNHLQESDARPSYLCSVCLRKLQAILRFNLLERYRGLEEWTTQEFWRQFRNDPKENLTDQSEASARPQGHRRGVTAVPRPASQMASRPSRTSQSKSTKPTQLLSTTATPVTVFFEDKRTANRKKTPETHAVTPPPLEKFENFHNWLHDAVQYLSKE